jgi:transposase
MLRQMERSAIKVLAKRGLSQRRIAQELGRSPTTIARVLKEPVDQRPAARRRRSKVDPYRPQIEQWLTAGLSIVRMLELARADPDRPYTGGRAVFSDHVRRIRLEVERAAADVPVRFEGLPAEYLQVDWGEVARFPFAAQRPGKRFFLACRLKHSRWSWVRFTADMRQETLFRGLVDCFAALGFVPWVLVFDNMKTVTSGRDARGQPVWTPALLQLAAEFGFHPEACAVGAANQKGAVENLVKWTKGHLLPGRTFLDDADLARQADAWLAQVNGQPSAATGVPPAELLPREAAQGGPLPAAARDYGLLEHGQVSAEALVSVRSNRYSVPVALVGLPVTVRLHRDRVRLWRDTELVADHPRAPDGARRRVIDVAHFAPLFPAKPRAQVMLYRQALLELGGPAERLMTELSRRQRAHLGPEVLGVYALYEAVGAADLLAAMARAAQADDYRAAALGAWLARPRGQPALPPLALAGAPTQAEIDRPLSAYEALVQVDVALDEAVAAGVGR